MKRYFSILILMGLVVSAATGVNWYSTKTINQSSKLDISMQRAYGKEKVLPVAVIGSGPAGLSAALYTARASIYTVIFEGGQPGGQLTTTTYVENWPGTKKMLGSALIDNLRAQAKEAGAVISNDTIECVDFSTWPFKLQTGEGQIVYALSVVIATGAEPKKLDVPGESKYWGRGVTTCAVCDAPFFKEKDVVVIGGGDSAVEEATLLASYAKKVTMLVRGDKLRASVAMQNRLKDQEKIQILYNTKITEIKGDNESVTAVELKNIKDDRVYNMPIDGVFLAIGHSPNSGIFKKYLDLDSQGYIELNNGHVHSQSTSVPGIYAAGDVADHTYRQAGVASGDGIKAGMDAIEFLNSQGYNDQIKKNLADNFYDPELEGEQLELEHIATLEDFDKLSREKLPLVIDVGAEWCSSCKALAPIVKHVASKYQGKVNFAYIDLSDDPKDLVAKFNIQAVPSILVFKKGKLVSKYERKVFNKQEFQTLVGQLAS